jgi:uncharacterized membrane protein YidH (DUF202 family)
MFASWKPLPKHQPIHGILEVAVMGRNLYILAAALLFFALISFGLSFSHFANQVGSPSDAGSWRMTGLALLCVGLVVALLGVMSALFEQAERRASAERQSRRRRPNP